MRMKKISKPSTYRQQENHRHASFVSVEDPSVLVMVVTAVVEPSAIGVVTVVLASALVLVVDVDVVVLASALVIVVVSVEDPSLLDTVVTHDCFFFLLLHCFLLFLLDYSMLLILF